MTELIKYRLDRDIQINDTVIMLDPHGEFKLSLAITDVLDDGFIFTVLNGAWEGTFDTKRNSLTVDYHYTVLNAAGDIFPVNVKLIPHGIRREYYL